MVLSGVELHREVLKRSGHIRNAPDRTRMTKHIVICATQRSGSTLLCEDMRATRRLGRPNETFIPIIEKAAPADFAATLEAFENKFIAKDGLFAIKVMMSYLPDIEAGFAASGCPVDVGARGQYPRFLTRYRDAHWIWIRRRDVKAQAISREMARQTGVTHAIHDLQRPFFLRRGLIRHDEHYNRDAQVDLDRIISEVGQITAENDAWQEFFAQAGIEPLNVEYEDIVEPRKENVRAIADFCGIELRNWKMERRLVPLSNEKSSEIRAALIRRMNEIDSAGVLDQSGRVTQD